MAETRADEARRLIQEGGRPTEVARALGISRQAVWQATQAGADKRVCERVRLSLSPLTLGDMRRHGKEKGLTLSGVIEDWAAALRCLPSDAADPTEGA